MGRPPLGERAMTDAERHRRYYRSLTAARDERTALLQDNERLRKLLVLLKAQIKAINQQIKAINQRKHEP